ncbi:hypothetical protein [Chthonobacter rhizosphaerae]|uniref:hypothetical protein n=1 Tax=Chthonobacter rhizosphaerae TaxID=2735553 RepID=UPI0015EF8EF2|nr:hypothetical protein [Chthonobacter rhizosphaerae]
MAVETFIAQSAGFDDTDGSVRLLVIDKRHQMYDVKIDADLVASIVEKVLNHRKEQDERDAAE